MSELEKTVQKSEELNKSFSDLMNKLEDKKQEMQAQKPIIVESLQAVSEVAVSEVGVISSTTSITGTLNSKGNIKIEGNIVGDIFALGDIKVTGKVTGDIDGGNIELEGCNIEGHIKARGDVNVDKDSVISADMYGQLITINGTIKGNIEAHKGAHLSSTSVVKGSIVAPTLSMDSGAEIQGKVNVTKVDKK